MLDWLARQSDLALHVKSLPIGSFTYSDSRSYTPDEAINRINLFLIPERFTLVRSGKLLSIISLDDERSVRQLDAMAELVKKEDLESLGRHELVKCLIPLDELDPNDVLQELGGLMLIREPAVLGHTNQLLVTETAGKILTVQQVLTTMADPKATAGPVKHFPLGELDADRVLAQIRPHVGLDPLAMTGVNISLSLDPDGRQLLVSGSKENLDAVAAVLETLQANGSVGEDREKLEFRLHPVGNAELQTVVNVLTTLLADEDVRMAPDVKSNQIALMATAEVHDLVTTVIKRLENQNEVEFDVIELKTVDPRYAVALLNQIFQSSLPTGQGRGPVPPDQDVPRIDADLVNMRLFVRAKRSQIEEIRRVINRLGETSEKQGNIRLLPYQGARAIQMLDTARKFWPGQNEVLIFPPHEGFGGRVLERAIDSGGDAQTRPPSEDREDEKPLQNSKPTNPVRPSREAKQDRSPGSRRSAERTSPADDLQNLELVYQVKNDEGSAGSARWPEQLSRSGQPALIKSQYTSRGILIQSDDVEALNRFENHVRMIAGPGEIPTQQLAVFYLKHTLVQDANRILASLLDGTVSTAEQIGGSLVSRSNSNIFNRGLRSRISDTDGDAIYTIGSATILPDSRLNRLFILGTAADILSIEQHLQIIDKKSSLTDVETHGKPHVIQLRHATARDVAALLRDAYTGRIKKDVQQSQQNPQGGPNQGTPQRDSQNQRGGGNPAANQRGRQDQQRTENQEPKMTLAVDEPGNSLVITAPDQLYREVEALVLSIDKNSARTIQVIRMSNPDSKYVRNTLTKFFGNQVTPIGSRNRSGGR